MYFTRTEIRQYTQPRLSHAKVMDTGFTHWQAVIADLRAFPKAQREQRLRYVSNPRTNMIDRTGLMYGGLQHLGPFPLLLAFPKLDLGAELSHAQRRLENGEAGDLNRLHTHVKYSF